MSNSDSPVVVGIDLGTTYSLVAAMQGGQPVVLPNSVGELLTPSAVSLGDDGRMLVGAAARARATTRPERTALTFKRDMGTSREYELGRRKLTPPELSAMVLAQLKHDAEAALGRPVEEAVVTVPAWFGEHQRKATRDAGTIAGLKVERIINEPTAAALAYGLHERHREQRAVVLDLGGGTFDVTVLEIIEGVIEIQATAGDSHLGGEDFTDALARHLSGEVAGGAGVTSLHEDPRGWARLREAADQLKLRLTDADAARVAVPGLPVGGGRALDFEATVSRELAESLWAELLDRIRRPILRALRDASVRPEAIDEVLLVGGATRMPAIARLAAQVFGRLPLETLPPDEAVALGAAIQAGLKTGDAALDDMVVTDIAPFTLGISTATDMGGQRVSGLFTPILERGTVIPASRVKRFSTVSDFQREIHIEVFQGEHSLCQDNTRLGEYVVKGIPPAGSGEESVDVRFTYDLNGLLEVETTVLATGERATMVVERTPGQLTQAQIADARRAMERIKFHPREALPNATALERADALYVELTGPRRSQLGQVIAAFRAALESQDPEVIEAQRALLVRVTKALK